MTETPNFGRRYLFTSEELLDPQVDAVEVGMLETGRYKEVHEKMVEEAQRRNIAQPLMVADLVFSQEKLSELGSPGQPYPIAEQEWETFARDVPEYCGDMVPKIYMVDGTKYSAPI